MTEANGARSRFYDNMRVAGPGDIVLSYADGRVGRIGIVADFAISSPKPEEFGLVGTYWSSVGWLLPVQWLKAPLAVRPKLLIARLAPVLPPKHSPIQPTTGNGNQKAYLAEVGRAVIDLIFEAAKFTFADIFVTPIKTVSDFAETLDDLVERNIREDKSLDRTVREQLTRARRGQGLFRKRVLDIEPVCRITGIEKPNLLIASHVKPWRACSTAAERLDGFNGLMLAPQADFLFDRGLIGFEDDGRPLFSSQLAETDAAKLGLRTIERPLQRPFPNESGAYFQHHRSTVYIP
ncbi:HNH endonuclease [Mesorhizobium sp. ES1-4]|uniref:HNH endonuclease n=1 Tax=Mesorhizobium sp. ES1-4 TaxID=2876627 RepID=UPI001CD02E44|nr:HNH endonuclease [Mesorhizobium sp. ES1-4]MBZ9797768.1 HNH endonuclease [Mesorhizobium sp. ES1-4]